MIIFYDFFCLLLLHLLTLFYFIINNNLIIKASNIAVKIVIINKWIYKWYPYIKNYEKIINYNNLKYRVLIKKVKYAYLFYDNS